MVRSSNIICKVDYVNIITVLLDVFSLFIIYFYVFNIKNMYVIVF